MIYQTTHIHTNNCFFFTSPRFQPVACCPFSLKHTAIQISLYLGKLEAITQVLSDGEMGKEYQRWGGEMVEG